MQISLSVKSEVCECTERDNNTTDFLFTLIHFVGVKGDDVQNPKRSRIIIIKQKNKTTPDETSNSR